MDDAAKGNPTWSRGSARGIAVLAALGLLSGSSWAEETRTVAAGPRYEAGGLHRFFFGSGYRDLWAEPISVPVLDLATWSGGLVPEKKGGGKQTASLKLKGKDGREWRFRSIDKDPTAVLPETLRETFAVRVAQDQISASHPGSLPVVDILTEAAGIPHVKHRIVLLPDDERLGEFRGEFAGMLGALEEDSSVKPPVTPGFEGFTKLVDTDELDELLDADSRERLDSRSFLRARLLDLLIGDSDRHRKQWDWAKEAQTGRFVAVPTDRDLAFVRFDGLLLRFARPQVPQLVKFDEEYPGAVALHWQSRVLDRRYLADLEWPAWQQTAEELQARLPDAVIDDAVRRLPPPYFPLGGPTLAARLKARRDGLPTMARRFYEVLAREAEIYGTDEPESAQLLRQADGSVEVVLAGATGVYFRRRFIPAETEEVRVFLKGGDDRVISEGHGPPEVTVRLVGGEGNDLLDDSAAGHTRFYDSSGDNRVVEGPGTKFSDEPYSPPVDSRGIPERDWGSQSQIVPWVRASEDYGLVLGGLFRRTGFGFRKHPYGERHSLRAGYSTGLETGGVEYGYDSLRTDNRTRFQLTARVSALDVIHYYGFGNATQDTGPQSFHDVKQTQYLLAPSYRLGVNVLDVSLGPVLKYADTDGSSGTLLGVQQPYGADRFGQVGARLRVAVDRRELHEGRSRGGMFALEGTVYPGLWSVTDTFGKLRAEGVSFVTADLPLEPTLALRAGGERLFGPYPFHEAASLGGSESLRGLLRQRYIGDASAFGNAELRLLLLRRERSLFPRFGVFGIGDVGRIFLEGESSDRWHTALGGGIFLSVAEPKNVLSVAFARSEGRVRFYLQGGFSF
jgi:hypothetical protein